MALIDLCNRVNQSPRFTYLKTWICLPNTVFNVSLLRKRYPYRARVANSPFKKMHINYYYAILFSESPLSLHRLVLPLVFGFLVVILGAVFIAMLQWVHYRNELNAAFCNWNNIFCSIWVHCVHFNVTLLYCPPFCVWILSFLFKLHNEKCVLLKFYQYANGSFLHIIWFIINYIFW